MNSLQKTIYKTIISENKLITVLRVTLGFIFLWFGLLKAAGYNPVFELVHGTYPILASDIGNIALGVFEVGLGLLLLSDKFRLITHTLILLHLLGTLITFITTPHLMFDPHFPILSLSGEFVFKNIALAAAGLVVLAHEKRRR